MARLPDPSEIERRQAQPSRQIVSYREGIVEGAVTDASAQFADMARKEQANLEQLQARKAAATLREAEVELSYGKTGYLSVKNGDVLARPLVDEYTTQLNKKADDIAATLSPQAAEVFNSYREDRIPSFKQGILQHSMREVENYKEETYKADIASRYDLASKMYDNPVAVEEQLGGIDAAVAQRMRELGIDPARDPKLAGEMVKSTRGGLHVAVVEEAIQRGDTATATAYLDKNREDMTLAQLKSVENKLKPANTFATAKPLAAEAFGMLEAGKPAAEVEKYVLGKAGNDKDVYSQTQSILTQMQQAARVQDAEEKGTVIEKFSSSPNRSTMNTLLNSPEYRALSNEQRGNVSEYMRHQVEAHETRTETQRWQHPKAFELFMNTLDDPNFVNMTNPQLYALMPEIGPALTNKLLSEHRTIKQGAARFQIDKELLNEAIPPSVIKNKAKSNAYRGIVESTLAEWKIANPGKIPTLEDQKAIARSANTEWVTVGSWWNTELPAYELKAGTQAFPKEFGDSMKAAAKAKGVKLTDEQIFNAWQLQRGR